jgi:hypothetical protein
MILLVRLILGLQMLVKELRFCAPKVDPKYDRLERCRESGQCCLQNYLLEWNLDGCAISWNDFDSIQ